MKQQLSQAILTGKTLQVVGYLTVTYNAKSDTVFISCDDGCCNDSMSLADFLELYRQDFWEYHDDED